MAEHERKRIRIMTRKGTPARMRKTKAGQRLETKLDIQRVRIGIVHAESKRNCNALNELHFKSAAAGQIQPQKKITKRAKTKAGRGTHAAQARLAIYDCCASGIRIMKERIQLCDSVPNVVNQ